MKPLLAIIIAAYAASAHARSAGWGSLSEGLGITVYAFVW